MTRFVRTFFVKRRAQVTVLQDSALREFIVYRWRAGEGLDRVEAFGYAPGCAEDIRQIAVAEARYLATVEERERDAAIAGGC